MTSKHGLPVLLTALVLVLVGYGVWSWVLSGTPPSAGGVGVQGTVVVAGESDDSAELVAPLLVGEGGEAPASRVDVDQGLVAQVPADGSSGGLPLEPVDQVRLRVLVRTPFGDPLGGVEVVQVPLGVFGSGPGRALDADMDSAAQATVLGTTSANGELVLDTSRGMSNLGVRGSGLRTLVPGAPPAAGVAGGTAVIIAGPVRRIDGLVTDVDGDPLPGATVMLMCLEDFSARLGVPVQMNSQILSTVTANELGEFVFPRATEAPKTVVRGTALGFDYQNVDGPDRGDSTVNIPLTPTRQGQDALRGRVVRSDGMSCASALVAILESHHSTRVTAETGSFELPLDPKDTVVRATLPGFQPASFERAAGDAWPDELILTLGEASLSLEGTVVDEDGHPLAGLHVGLADGTLFGAVNEPGERFSTRRRLEDLGAKSGLATTATTGAGVFHIDGLLNRSYSLMVLEPGTLRGASFGPYDAGQTGLRLVLDTAGSSGLVAGRVTDAKGLPLAGIQVRTSRRLDSLDQLNLARNRVSGLKAFTDSEGRFQLGESVTEGVNLIAFSGVEFVRLETPLSDFDDLQDVEVSMARNSPFRIEWSGGEPPAGAFKWHLEDEDGETKMMLCQFGQGYSGRYDLHVNGGTTPVQYAGEGRYDVVLVGRGEGPDIEIERFSIVLEGAEQQTIVH